MTQSEPTIVHASTDESANEIIERAGVETIRTDSGLVFWRYRDHTVERPDARYWKERLLEHFNIQIEYQDKNQLSMFEG